MLQTQNYDLTPELSNRRTWIQGVKVFSYMYEYLKVNEEKARELSKLTSSSVNVLFSF